MTVVVIPLTDLPRLRALRRETADPGCVPDRGRVVWGQLASAHTKCTVKAEEGAGSPDPNQRGASR